MPDDNKKDTPCGKYRQVFIDCVLQESECIRQGHKFQDCIKPNVFPKECNEARVLYYNCRRSLVTTQLCETSSLIIK